MKLLCTQEKYKLSKYSDLLPLKCYYCNNKFYKNKKKISYFLNHNISAYNYCSRQCASNSVKIKLTCLVCQKSFLLNFLCLST